MAAARWLLSWSSSSFPVMTWSTDGFCHYLPKMLRPVLAGALFHERARHRCYDATFLRWRPDPGKLGQVTPLQKIAEHVLLCVVQLRRLLHLGHKLGGCSL